MDITTFCNEVFTTPLMESDTKVSNNKVAIVITISSRIRSMNESVTKPDFIKIKIVYPSQDVKDFYIQCSRDMEYLVKARCFDQFLPKLLQANRYAKIRIALASEDTKPYLQVSIHEIECQIAFSKETDRDHLQYLIRTFAVKSPEVRIKKEARKLARQILKNKYQIGQLENELTRLIVGYANTFDGNPGDFVSGLINATGFYCDLLVISPDSILLQAKSYFDALPVKTEIFPDSLCKENE